MIFDSNFTITFFFTYEQQKKSSLVSKCRQKKTLKKFETSVEKSVKTRQDLSVMIFCPSINTRQDLSVKIIIRQKTSVENSSVKTRHNP